MDLFLLVIIWVVHDVWGRVLLGARKPAFFDLLEVSIVGCNLFSKSDIVQIMIGLEADFVFEITFHLLSDWILSKLRDSCLIV